MTNGSHHDEFHRMTPDPNRHRAGRTMRRADRTPEERRALAMQTFGCAAILFAFWAGIALVILAWSIL